MRFAAERWRMGFADADADGLRKRDGVVEVGRGVSWGGRGDGDGGVVLALGGMFSLSLLLLLESAGGGLAGNWAERSLG